MTDPGSANAGVAGGTTSLSYEPRTLLSRQDNPDGSSTTLSYDPVRRIVQIRHAESGAEIERAFYGYDAAGRPLYRDTLAGIATWSYDQRDRLTSESLPSGLTTWLYDEASRRIGQIAPAASTSYAYDVADQLLTSTTAGQVTTFLYDRNGSTTSIETPDAKLTTYAWDAANRLASITLPSGGRYTELYRFDDMRVGQSGPNGVQTFTWAEGEVLAQRGTSATVAWEQVFTHKLAPQPGFAPQPPDSGGTAPSLLRAVGSDSSGAAHARQYHLDALGSVQAIGGASSFLPSDETGLMCWLEGDYGLFKDTALTTAATTNGDPVLGWQDRSGQGNHFTNASSVCTLSAPGVNGRNTLHCNGATNSFLKSASLGTLFRGAQPCTIFVVVQQNNTDALAFTWNTHDNSSDYGYVRFRCTVSGVPANTQVMEWDGSSNYAYDSVDVGTDPALGRYSFDGTTMIARTNGDAGTYHATTSARSSSTDQAIVGALVRPVNPLGVLIVDGEVCAVLVYDHVLSDSAAASVEQYLRGKWMASGATTLQTDAWGNVLSGGLADNPALYLGGLGYWQEPDLALDYVRARWLNPATGSWLSVDPVTTEPRYRYAGNAPTSRVDPSGKIPPDQNGPDPRDKNNTLINVLVPALKKAAEIIGPMVSPIIGGFFPDLKSLQDYERAQGAKVMEPLIKAVLAAPQHGRQMQAGAEGWRQMRSQGELEWRLRHEVIVDVYHLLPDRWPLSPIRKLPDAVHVSRYYDKLQVKFRHSWFGAFLPPDPLKPDFCAWSAGFLWGLLDYFVFCFGDQVFEIFDKIGFILTFDNSVQRVLEEYHRILEGAGASLEFLRGMSGTMRDYDKGKLLATLIGLAITIRDIIRLGVVVGRVGIGTVRSAIGITELTDAESSALKNAGRARGAGTRDGLISKAKDKITGILGDAFSGSGTTPFHWHGGSRAHLGTLSAADRAAMDAIDFSGAGGSSDHCVPLAKSLDDHLADPLGPVTPVPPQSVADVFTLQTNGFKFENVRGRTLDAVEADIIERMRRAGPGARAYVDVKSYGPGPRVGGQAIGHTFNVINRRGRIIFMDVQSRSAVSITDLQLTIRDGQIVRDPTSWTNFIVRLCPSAEPNGIPIIRLGD